MRGCELIREKLSAYLDGELTHQESQKVRAHLGDCAQCRAVYEDFARLREQVGRLEFPQPPEEEWSRVMANLAFKTTRGAGWLLWIGGAALLLGYGLYELIRDPTISVIEHVGVLALLSGSAVLFLTVLIERLAAYRSDKYKDVEK